MHDDDLPFDPVLAHVEAVCQLVDALNENSNKEVRAELMVALRAVVARLQVTCAPPLRAI